MASGSKKVILAALIGNLLIALTKFSAFVFTASSAMLSESVHSFVDTGNQVLLLYGLRRAKKPADENFPFGHGKEIYFWSFVVAILIFSLGAGVSIYKGVHHLIHPVPIQSPYINYGVLALSLIFEGAAWFFAFKEFTRVKGKWNYVQAVKRSKDPSIFLVLFEDSAAMIGLAVAFIGIFLSHVTGIPYFDGIAAVLIGLILAGTAIWLAYETKGLLIGESANKEIVRDIREIALAFKSVENVNEILTLHMGPDFILLNLSVDFADNLAAGDIETIVAEMDSKIKQSDPRIKRVFVEAEARRTPRANIP